MKNTIKELWTALFLDGKLDWSDQTQVDFAFFLDSIVTGFQDVFM